MRKHYLILCAAALALSSCGQNVPKADSLEAQSDALMAEQAYPAAMDLLQRAVKYDSNEPRRWVKLGRAQRSAGMPALAAISFQHALDLDPANVESLQNLSILEVRAGRFDDARNYVDPLMVLSPDDVAGLLALGAIAVYKKQLPQGLIYADKLIKAAPASMSGYSLKAHVLEAMDRPAEAARILAQQQIFNPNDKDLALQLLPLYQKAGNREGIRNTAILLAGMMPDDPRYQMEAARAYFARGDRAKSDEIINGLVRRYPYLPDIAMAAVQFWHASLPPDEAAEKIGALTDKAKGRTKAALCDWLIESGKTNMVVALLAPVAKQNVTIQNVDLFTTYANALIATGNLKAAKDVADKILSFDSGIDDALVVRARVYLAEKKYTEALNDAQIAVSNDNQDPAAAILLPQIHAASGNQILAARTWGDASSRLPDDVSVLAARVQWLFQTNQPSIATGLTSFFARSHSKNREAWELYRNTCITAHDDYCAMEATQTLERLGAKPKAKAKPKSGV